MMRRARPASGPIRFLITWTIVYTIALSSVFLVPTEGDAEPLMADRIVAIVDDEVVLHSDIVGQMLLASVNQGLDVPNMSTEEQQSLYSRILDNMVQEKILLERAEEDSLYVDDEEVEEAVRSKMRELRDQHGEQELADQLAKEGLAVRDLRDRFRKDFRKDYLRQQMYAKLSDGVSVSSRDIEAFRVQYADAMPPLVSLSHILLKAKPSESQAEDARKRIQALLERARAGEDFAGLARDYSDDKGSRQTGGDLGFFGRGMMLPAFEEAAFALRPGELSEPVLTRFGYHIIQGVEREETRVRVRHVLISMETGEAEVAVARDRAVEMYKEIASGADFADMAREHSEDDASASRGGRLGTYVATNLPPAFVDAIQAMRLGDVSPPVPTDVGWHILRLDDDVEALEDIVGQLLLQTRFDEVIADTRERLYVDVRP